MLDLASVIGVIVGVVMIIFGIVTAGGGVGALSLFFNLPSVFITFGGGLACALTSVPLSRFLSMPKYAKFVFNAPVYDPSSIIKMLITFSEKARREGILALEDDIAELTDPFMKKGIQLVVDGTEPEKIKNVLQIEMDKILDRHGQNQLVFDKLDSFFPAFGMIGTLIGLVLMLTQLSNKEALGQALSTALITTFYGTIGANVIAHPFKTKLEDRDSQEMLIKDIMLEGIMSIQAGENPRILKDKLISFLAPSMREAINREMGD
jgi:chemotaxis protein MotA